MWSGFAVRQEQRVEPTDATAPHCRGHDAAPDIERATVPQSACVHEQRRRIGELDQRRVALSDIEADEGEPTVRRPWPAPDVRRQQDPDRCTDQEHTARKLEPSSPMPTYERTTTSLERIAVPAAK